MEGAQCACLLSIGFVVLIIVATLYCALCAVPSGSDYHIDRYESENSKKGG